MSTTYLPSHVHLFGRALIRWRHPSKRVVEDPEGSNYSQAVDPETLLKLLMSEKMREVAIEKTVVALKNSSPAREKWPDPCYWDVQAKLELSLTLEVSTISESYAR